MSKSTENVETKLKILALHGYRQNADSFKGKLGSFRKFVSKYAEFVFASAPHPAPPLEAGTDPDPSQRSWWFNKEDRTFKGTNEGGPAYGFEESLKLLEKTWEAEGCHGLLGFSQGACFAGLLCDLSARGMTTIKPQFAVLASGFRSGSLVHLNYYENKVQIPSLHIFGETDEIITKDMSVALSETFLEPEIVTHPGGHYFPAQASMKQMYVDFFRDQLQNHLEAKELQNATEENSFHVADEVTPEMDQQLAGSDSDSD
ncbi:esterase AGAP003155 [Anopheles ziemanni]|uniref:esterase AGAP003155 n=1 Tax=Anopheles coustani TaxID=139045 RepID=UPI00265AB681|nr:esterase AGAP003155 [Anopheles coustani]XP_058174420.1 esterase AGAP003155 [Anopheles ziemanni]